MKTSRIALLLALLAACAVAALLVLGNPASKKRNYTLGAIGNFKGKNAQVGVEAFNAINLAYAEYKDTHPNGFNLNILSVDDSWEPSKSLPAYLSCISNVDLLIILTGSSSFMLIYDEVLKHPDILHYALGPTTTLLSGKKDNVVRNLCDMEKEQKMIAEFASSRKFERLLIVTETDFNAKYTEPAARYFQQYAHIPIVDVVGFSGNLMDTDKAKELLKANHYDAMYALIGGMPRESAILIQQARAIQKDIPVLITPWIRGLIFEQALGTENNHIFMPCHLKLFHNPSIDHFSAAYEKMFGAESKEYFSPLMYDLANSLFETLDKTGSAKTSRLLPALLASEFSGTSGTVRFDEFGDADSQMHFYEMKDGVWHNLSPESVAAP